MSGLLARLWCWIAHRRYRYCEPGDDEPVNDWVIGCSKCKWEREITF